MKPISKLNLFSLEDEINPEHIGVVSYNQSRKELSVDLNDQWLKSGFSLNPKDETPIPHESFMSRGENIQGYLADSCPDEWGKYCIRTMDIIDRFGPMELLYFAGHNRFGMLGFSTEESYVPCEFSPIPKASSIEELSNIVTRIRSKKPLTDYEKLVSSSSKSLGGARPKMIVWHEGAEWIAKFPRDDYVDLSLIEFATNKLAQECGIKTADVEVIDDGMMNHILLVKRFDRNDGKRSHSISAGTMLGEHCNYITMAEIIRQRSPESTYKADLSELYTRMAFNVFMDNTDDHEKNHAFTRNSDGTWSLTPAFDISIQGNGLLEQALMIGTSGTEGSIDNLLSAHERFGLSESEAVDILRKTMDVVMNWKEFFSQEANLTSFDIDMMSDYINHDSLNRRLIDFESGLRMS